MNESWCGCAVTFLEKSGDKCPNCGDSWDQLLGDFEMDVHNFTEVVGLPERKQMCHDCPSRPRLFRGSANLSKNMGGPAHRCHNAMGSVCAGSIGDRPETRKILVDQLYREMGV